MQKLLIVDPTDYKKTLEDILCNDFSITFAESAFDATVLLDQDNYDLIITEIDLPGDNSFELYYYIKNNYNYLPIIMFTEKNIDDYFEKIFDEGIPNILHKSASSSQILNLSSKLTKQTEIFGLKNYLPDIKTHKQIKIKDSNSIQTAIDLTISNLENFGLQVKEKTILNLVLSEILINAIYHSHGFTEEKLTRKPVKLPKDKFVSLTFAHNDKSAGISITDFNGNLSKTRILESMYNAVNQKKIFEEAARTGEEINISIEESGRGIDLVRQLAGEYYFILKPGEKTEVILIFPFNLSFTDKNFSSLKIIEA